MQNKALVQRWFDEVWNKGREAAIDEMLAPRAVVHGVGPEGFKRFHTAYRTAFPDVKVTIEDMVAEGDRVALRWRATATHTGPLLNVPPTGKPVTFEGMGIVRVDKGMIVEGWNLFDQLGMFTQLGVVNLPG